MILITGGAGFIGSHMTRYFLDSGESVAVFDNLSTGSIANIPKGVEFIFGDIAEQNLTDFMADVEPETVINLAAMSTVEACEKYPREAEHVNVRGVIRLIDACTKAKVPNFIQASSAAVYAEDKSKYGATKASAERIVNGYKYNSVNCRFFNVYGPGGRGVIPAFLGKGAVIHGGKQTRDFIYVEDVCSAVDAVIQNIKHVKDFIDIGTGVETSISELASILNVRLFEKPALEGEIMSSKADTTALKLLSWFPRTSLLAGIRVTKESIDG